MSLRFLVTEWNTSVISEPNVIALYPDSWDDYGCKTSFYLIVSDENSSNYKIGSIKIGYNGQGEGWTKELLPPVFSELPDNFYSLGQDAEFYLNLVKAFPDEFIVSLLSALGDLVSDPLRFALAKNEAVVSSSLLRFVNIDSVETQFRRILRREAPLTEYNFSFKKGASDRYSGVAIDFEVNPDTKPSSNIHVLIGRNGVGKTTLLNDMADTLLQNRGSLSCSGQFYWSTSSEESEKLPNSYFAGLVSVSFSAFDPFNPPSDRTDANGGMRYYYVGLKKRKGANDGEHSELKDKSDLSGDFTGSLNICFALSAKRNRWLKAVKKLESDPNFAEMGLCDLEYIYYNNQDQFTEKASNVFSRLSSGHAIVLLTVTKLVEAVEERTLVLFDEPEGHLHPPLLSALIRALSDLLVNRNGVAILATHSPVVLQEVPKSCVSIIRRTRLVVNVDRPESETFAENVGVLTREVFGLEVTKSGFHDLLQAAVSEGKDYEHIVADHKDQLGFEGLAILRSLIISRNAQIENSK